MRVVGEIKEFKSDSISSEGVEELKAAAKKARLWSVLATSVANSGHPAGALSSMDIYMTLLGVANLTPENCNDLDRDRIVISHGHTSAGFYSALAAYGFFEAKSMYSNFRRAGSPFQGHVERDVPGVDWGSGNLGQGLSAGVGFALAARARGSDSRTWVVMGDGGQVKGQIAEARRIAIKEKLYNLTAIIDWNDIQISGRLGDVMPFNLPELWKSDGWHVIECDGHSYTKLYEAMKAASTYKGCVVILCRTVMGKGVSFMQNIPDYHGKAATGEKLKCALEELGGSLELYQEAVEVRKGAVPKGRDVTSEKVSLEVGSAKIYTGEDSLDNRGAFGAALAEIGELNYKKQGSTPLIVFDCDLSGSVKTDGFSAFCCDNFIQTGIQEHSTATAVGAASIAGALPLWAAFGVFGIDEVYNQQRLNDINKTNAKIALTHVGLDVGEDGMTHQCIDYIGLFRNTFGWRVVVPADPNQTDRATRWMLSEPGNICVAMGRSKLPVLLNEDGTPFYGEDYSFKYGAIDTIREGSDAAILSMGHFAGRAVKAHELLKKEGINVKVLHCASPLGMDSKELFDLVGSLPLLTCEDHHVNTGMGSIVAMMTARAGKAIKLTNMGVSRYALSGASEDVISDMGLGVVDIANQVKELLNK